MLRIETKKQGEKGRERKGGRGRWTGREKGRMKTSKGGKNSSGGTLRSQRVEK